MELLQSVADCITAVQRDSETPVATMGLSVQRESALAWDSASGEPLSPVISWQDRRTGDRARALADSQSRVRDISGLPLDPMFSALKLSWLLDEIDPARRASRAGRISLGTVDSWLAARLAGEHRIEVGNASRTQLLDLRTGDWSTELLDLFDIPRACMPRVAASDETMRSAEFGIPINAVLGDSHAALYVHGIRNPGEFKATFGTGSSIMGLDDGWASPKGLDRTIAWGVGGSLTRALEGNILSTGATVAWLARILDTSPEKLADLAQQAESSGDVEIVPAFHGLGAPWWDDDATAVISGLNLGTGRAELARSAFESITLQIDDVLQAARAASGTPLSDLHVDGGPSRNDWLMQLQADISEQPLVRRECADSSALGAAQLAAESAGIVQGQLLDMPSTRFLPDPDYPRDLRRRRWALAVSRARLSPSSAPVEMRAPGDTTDSHPSPTTTRP